MRGLTHARSGRTIWLWCAPLVISPHVNVENAVLLASGMAIATVTAYAPDIDHRMSKATSVTPFGHTVHRVVRVIFGPPRMGTHSLLAALLAAIVAAGLAAAVDPKLAPLAGLAALAGWFGGIGADLLTERGCALLWPFVRTRYRLLRLRTSDPKPAPMNFGEMTLNVMLIAAQVYFVLSIPEIKALLP